MLEFSKSIEADESRPGRRFINSLSAKLFRYIFGAYFIVTLAVTAIQLAVEYNHVKRNILGDLHSLAETFQPVLSESLWTFNDDSLNTTIFSMLKLESVIGVKIFNDRGDLVKSAGTVNTDSEEIKSKSFLSRNIYHYEIPLTFNDQDGKTKILGKTILYSGSGVVINKIKYGFILIIINSLIKTTALWLIFVYFLKKIVSQPLARLTQSVNNLEWMKNGNTDDTLLEFSLEGDEIGMLAKRFREMRESISRMMVQLQEQSRLQAIAHLARQVAHDIRSPLAAMNVVTSMISELAEDKRLLIRRAVHRIDDIANELISRSRPVPEGESSEQTGEMSIQLLSGVVETIVSEKRLQFRTKHNITLDFQIASENYGLFARINPVSFKCILSNLINNSAEAIETDDGRINISLYSEAGIVILRITDNGCGIPSDILPQLMKEGASFGKKQGNGLGLYHASEMLKGWDGFIEVKSEYRNGTEVKIRLPRASEPNWFVRRLELPENGTVIILDDDDSIHEIWKGRFSKTEFSSLEILHFKDPKSVLEWYKMGKGQVDFTLGLFDYELIGSDLTGLNVIDQLGAYEKSILVTSRFDEEGIRQICINKAIRMIPKSMAGFVPLEMLSQVSFEAFPDYVLIDDCPVTRDNWNLTAQIAGKKLATYAHPASFMKDAESISKDSQIYVDVHLADGIRGEDITRQLHENGFQNVYLTTGSHPSEFEGLWWIKEIIGKDPPFLKGIANQSCLS